MSLSLAESYRWCARTTWRAGSSFYWALWLLPAQRRLAMQALYAFARHTDDLSDDPSDDFALGGETTTRRRAALAGWRSAVEAAFADPDEAIAGRSPSPLLPAVADTLRRFSIPPRHLLAIIDGVERDLDPVRYQTFAELRSYCELVASAVGLACLRIWGCDAPPATPHAIECGVAFQLTNILRDVGEDLRRGRLYLPCEELRAFGISDAEFFPNGGVGGAPTLKPDDRRWRDFVAFQIERAERAFRAGLATRDFLDASGRRSFDLMFRRYHELLDAVRRRDGDLFGAPPRVSRWRRLWIAAATLCGASPAAPLVSRPTPLPPAPTAP